MERTEIVSRRYHLEDKIDKIPQVKQGLVAACVLLIATKSKDLECDIEIEGKQFHIEISQIAVNQPEPKV